jgi:RNA polymerase primary sigma factor
MSNITGPFEEMEIVNALLSDATDKGYVTYDQILEALPEVENNLPLLETILEEIQNLGITLYENEEAADEGGDGVEELNGNSVF